jgi:hypothetical protein
MNACFWWALLIWSTSTSHGQKLDFKVSKSNIIARVSLGVISPTHKRTEGRAPVWGSEFTSKDPTLQGGSIRNRSYAERKIVDFGA